MLEQLKEKVYDANMQLQKYNLVIFTWGNVSAIDPETGLIVIKPSGVPYETLSPSDMVVVDSSGKVIEGGYRPSSDTITHCELYKNFPECGSIIHTHSPWATAWAQAGKAIPLLGTTHCDYFYDDIPCTRCLTDAEIQSDYELETGKVIVETFKEIDPQKVQAVLVHSHGPFVWGRDCDTALHNAVVLEYIAMMATRTAAISEGGSLPRFQAVLRDKHYNRKFGKNAYYGQN